MEFFEIKNKLLRVIDNKAFKDSIYGFFDSGVVDRIDIFIDDLLDWESIIDREEAVLELTCYFSSDGSYDDTFKFVLDESGFLVNSETHRTLHDEYPKFISADFNSEIYINIVDAYIQESDLLCPIELIPKLPDVILHCMHNQEYFKNYTIDDKIWLYEQTRNEIFVKKEVFDIFIF